MTFLLVFFLGAIYYQSSSGTPQQSVNLAVVGPSSPPTNFPVKTSSSYASQIGNFYEGIIHIYYSQLLLYRTGWDYDLESGIQEIRYILISDYVQNILWAVSAGKLNSQSPVCANSGITTESGIRVIDCRSVFSGALTGIGGDVKTEEMCFVLENLFLNFFKNSPTDKTSTNGLLGSPCSRRGNTRGGGTGAGHLSKANDTGWQCGGFSPRSIDYEAQATTSTPKGFDQVQIQQCQKVRYAVEIGYNVLSFITDTISVPLECISYNDIKYKILRL